MIIERAIIKMYDL